MNIIGIDHIELFADDANAAARDMCTTFGFRIAAQTDPGAGCDSRSLLLRHGNVRVLVTSASTENHPAARYVSRHGDGVGVIAFTVDDVAEVHSAAVAGGARSVQPPREHRDGGDVVHTAVVSGFGDVVHRLVDRRGGNGTFMPGRLSMIAADPETGDELMDVIDHVAVCVGVGELDPTVEFYRHAYGFADIFEEYIEIGEQAMASTVVQSPSGGATFTLLQPDPKRARGQIDAFIEWHGGAGVQHVAFRTDDIRMAVRTFAARGVHFGATPASYYDFLEDRLGGQSDLPIADLRELGVLVDHDHWGQMFQIFTQSTHPRRTLFLELIERHGAKTFGSANIRALYEAKERELAAVSAVTDPETATKPPTGVPRPVEQPAAIRQ